MRMTYERPIMQTELYVTDAYCKVCSDNPTLKAEFTTPDFSVNGVNSGWFSPRSGNPLSSSQVSDWDLSHTFDSGAAIKMIRPQGVSGAGETQYYWKCTCDDCKAGGEIYYLEYSTEWAKDYGENTFVLYKETSGNDSLLINWGNYGILPDNPDGNEDQAIGAITINTHDVLAFS